MLSFQTNFNSDKLIISVIYTFLLCSTQVRAEVKTDDVIKEELQSLSVTVASQRQVESLDRQVQQYTEDRRQLGYELRLQSKYRQQLAFQVKQLESALVELDDEMDNMRKTKIRLLPLLTEMHQGLEALVEQDLPFLMQERSLRLSLLKEKLADPTATSAQKLNKLIEAYQVEIGYGHSVETWQGRLSPTQEVNFLRVGRVGYYYLSLDAKTGAQWKSGSGWQTLDDQQSALLKRSIDAVNVSYSPSLLRIPALANNASL
ncbi:DUF3450 domain-containing protein [Vibrio tapetis]|uniref:TonB system biopolymer transport component Chromosome segregation ATPase n=1 Tax=Vibrio tapetis subsp. tapetis TaxID=1671868 RepID=A0A2N8ZAL5_9VIBR|nr:DUF3450 domain-containing protein [Vibrio tapetis]SON48960.1 conserved exported protein of unknown function [Vibrio tapetis subsp. tapetis]